MFEATFKYERGIGQSAEYFRHRSPDRIDHLQGNVVDVHGAGCTATEELMDMTSSYPDYHLEGHLGIVEGDRPQWFPTRGCDGEILFDNPSLELEILPASMIPRRRGDA